MCDSSTASATPTTDAGCPELLGQVGQLVHAHRARLMSVARREGLQAEDALDAVQEAFVTFLARPGACSASRDLEGALRVLSTITRNQARNGRRRHHRAAPHLSLHDHADAGARAGGSQPLPDAGPDGEELLARARQHQRLHSCVGQLGDLQRRVVTLRLLDEVAGEDVASQLGLTPGHVAVLLHRAKHQLRACLG
jgi:RNA polymerase sigma-70 factor (ECF subfamily)